jgi:hypothetical protein
MQTIEEGRGQSIHYQEIYSGMCSAVLFPVLHSPQTQYTVCTYKVCVGGRGGWVGVRDEFHINY